MKSSEQIQWIIILLVSTLLACIFLFFSPAYLNPLSVELTGTLLGVVIALSFSQVITLQNDVMKAENMKTKIDNELRRIKGHLIPDLVIYTFELQIGIRSIVRTHPSRV